MGADLQYTCLGNNQYRITLRFYRDCKGIAAPATVPITISAAGCAGAATLNVTLQPNTAINCPPGSNQGCEVSQLCPSQINQSACNYTGPGTAPYPGVRVHEYTGIITLPANCPNWLIRYRECCRNNAIDNVVNPSGNDMSIEAMINNSINPQTGQPYCNNSVAFASLPVPFVCVNSNVTYNNGAVDVDGDSLVYSLITPLGNGYNPMTFNAGWNVNNPVRTNPPSTFQFNSNTGQMAFTPAFQEEDVLAVRVSEFRNGVLVGYTMRDIQVTVLNCAIAIPSQNPINNVQNGNQVDSLKVQVCPGTPLQFDILATDPANHNLTLSSNLNSNPPAIPGASMVQVGTGDSVIARVTWTPQPSDTGCHTFVLTAENDDCPIKGTFTRVYTICVFTQVQLLSASTTYCGTPVQLTASGGTNFQWSPSTGPNAVSNPNVLNPTVSPAAPTWYYFTSDCGTDSVFVNAAPPFLYDAGQGGAICQNGQLPLNATTDNLYAPYTFNWVPATGLFHPVTGLPASNIPNPVASPLTTTNYVLYVTGSNGCTNADSVLVSVSGTGPVVVAKATPLNVCPGDTVRLDIVTNPQSCGISQTPCNGSVTQGQIGAGTGSTPPGSPTQYPTVYGHYSRSARHQFLYRASELLPVFGSGGEIRSIAFNLSQINTPNDTMRNFEIRIACTQATELSSWQPNLTTVFTPKNVALGNTLGWITHVLDFPYNWDGTSNLVIDICFNNPTDGTLNNKMQMTPTTFNSVYFSRGSTSQCGITGTPTTSTNRPNIRINMCINTVAGMPVSWTPASGPNTAIPPNIISPISLPQTPVIYNVDVTAPNGCVSSDYVYVNVDTSLRFFAFPVDTFFCSPTNVQLTTQVLGSPVPGSSFSYQWRNLNTNTVVGTSPTLTVSPTTSTTYVVTLNGGACILRDTVRVEIGTSIPVTLTTSPITCFGAANGRIRASISGGTPPIQYNWSTGATIDSIVNLVPGAYTVTVNDAQGCSGSATVNITEPPLLSATAQAQNVTCFGLSNGSVSVTTNGGTQPYNFSWSPAQLNQPNVIGLPANTYQVTVTDANGCTATTSALVNQPAALSVTVTSTNVTINGGSDGTAGATATGGTAPYTYVWTNGASTSAINNLIAGTYCVTVTDANGCTTTACAIINEPPPILLTFVTSNNACFGECNGSATVSASGGNAPYTFNWSNSIAGTSIINLCAGTYIVTVTDSTGASITGSTTITEPTALSITLNTTDITCNGFANGTITSSVSGGTSGYTYLWSNTTNTSSVNGLTSGVYTLTVTDANTCTATASATIAEPALLTATIASTTNVSCFGGADGTATANVQGGVSPYTYNWPSPGSGTVTASGFGAASYTLTVTDANTCTATTTFTINQPTPLSVTIASVKNANCFGLNDGEIGVTVTGATPAYTYLWSNGASTLVLSNVPAGVYTLTVTDANSCSATVSATVNQPDAIVLSFTATNPLCAGDATGSASVQAQGGNAPYFYDWTYTPQPNDNSVITGIPSGTYVVIVTDATNCTVQGNVALTDPATLAAQFINKQEISCANAADGQIEVSVSGGTAPISYNWSANISGSVATNLAPGNYTVTVIDNNGCSVVLNTNFTAPLPIQIQLLNTKAVTCPRYTDGSLQISAIGGTPGLAFAYQYSINGGDWQTSEFFPELRAGIYSVQIRDGQGCTTDTTVLITEPAELVLNLNPSDTLIDLGETITLWSDVTNYSSQDINYYSWSPINGVTCSDCSSTTVTPYGFTTYVLTVNYLADCSVSEQVNVYVGNADDFYIPTAFSPNGDGNNDVFTVYGNGIASLDLKVFNRWGELIFDSGSQWMGWDGTYKGVLQNPGVYSYQIEATYLNGKKKQRAGSITLIR